MEEERNLGPQPLGPLLEELGLKPADLVRASGEQLTHRMVARAVRGRRLTPKARAKVLRALNGACGGSYGNADLFEYGGPRAQGGQGSGTTGPGG